MAINLSRAWNAASLVPQAPAMATLPAGFQQGPANPTGLPGGGPTGTGLPTSSAAGNILAAIYGPNYQNLLSTADQSGQSGAADPALIEANAYAQMAAARRNLMEQSIMQTGAANWNARWGSTMPVASTTQTAFGSPFNSDWVSNQNYQRTLNQSANQAAQVAQAAALSPMYAPQVQSSVGQQNTGASFNPYGLSGWISPAQRSFSPGVSSPAMGLMSMGI